MIRRRPTTISVLLIALIVTPQIAAADSGKNDDTDQVVLVNAASKVGAQAPVAKIKRVFDAKGMLLDVPGPVDGMLDGRNLQVQDMDALRVAYVNQEFDKALRLVEANETRILDSIAAGDALPALTELSQWRGLIAAATDKPDEAVQWFRVALRFDPAWMLDKKLAAPSINRLIKKAKKEDDQSGRLKVDADPDNATVQIDGGKPQGVTDKIPLPAGRHLVVVSAEGRTTYADFIEIEANKVARLPITLEKESPTDRAAKAVNKSISAPSGEDRLKKTRGLSKVLGGAKLYVFVEDGSDERVTLRVYDIGSKRVSRPFEIDINSSMTEIQSKVMTALREPMLEPNQTLIIDKLRPRQWYERWYVWVGVAALAGGGALGYHVLTREPTSVRL
ncbi:MAG: PEGA domain-containing protein [Deltaproteobacteria bacterium]|nr:PEGA domain-containing protein [Deltaproteobacteria bacterium]MCW5801098.1 PEGA domain-containing protein [Deltaproteobacteria bacterium]